MALKMASVYCVAEIVTEANMLTSWPWPIHPCNNTSSAHTETLTAWLTELASYWKLNVQAILGYSDM